MKVFDLVAARTGLREHEALSAGYTPLTSQATPDDHKAYYPGAQTITIRITGDAATGRLLGAQLIGALGTETAKRVDTYATALFHGMTADGLSELDLSYTRRSAHRGTPCRWPAKPGYASTSCPTSRPRYGPRPSTDPTQDARARGLMRLRIPVRAVASRSAL